MPLTRSVMTVAPRPVGPLLLAGGPCDAAAALLREAGHAVQRAASAAALLRLARAEPPPGLIVVGDLPDGLPGLSLLSRLKDDPATRAIPLLYMADDDGDEELALALGAADCLALPLRPLVLLARVQAQLRLAALAGAAA